MEFPEGWEKWWAGFPWKPWMTGPEWARLWRRYDTGEATRDDVNWSRGRGPRGEYTFHELAHLIVCHDDEMDLPTWGAGVNVVGNFSLARFREEASIEIEGRVMYVEGLLSTHKELRAGGALSVEGLGALSAHPSVPETTATALQTWFRCTPGRAALVVGCAEERFPDIGAVWDELERKRAVWASR